MQYTGQFTDFYKSSMLPAIRSIITDAAERKPTQFNRLIKVVKSNRSIEQMSGWSGIGLATLINETESIGYDSVIQGFKKTFTHADYGLAVQVTHQMIRDDKVGLIEDIVGNLPISINETREIQAATLWNNAFTAGAYAIADGQALISANHPQIKAGGVQSNLLSPAELTMTSLQSALTMARTLKDSAGRLRRTSMKMLVVPPAMQWKALQLTKSVDDPSTANRATNTLKYGESGLPEVFVYDYLTSTSNWFIQGDPKETNLVWFDREAPFTRHWVDEPSLTGNHARQYAASYGGYGYLGIIGCGS